MLQSYFLIGMIQGVHLDHIFREYKEGEFKLMTAGNNTLVVLCGTRSHCQVVAIILKRT